MRLILQALLMEGHDESEAKQEAFEKFLPACIPDYVDTYMFNSDETTVARQSKISVETVFKRPRAFFN